MPDYRSMFDRDYIAEFDLQGRDVTVTIKEVKAGKVKNAQQKEARKPIVYFEGRDKALVLNSTNGKTIAAMYGVKTEAWAGKRITLFPTNCEAFGQTVPCIRVRPTIPKPTTSEAALMASEKAKHEKYLKEQALENAREAAPGLLAENWTDPTARVDKELLADLESGT